MPETICLNQQFMLELVNIDTNLLLCRDVYWTLQTNINITGLCRLIKLFSQLLTNSLRNLPDSLIFYSLYILSVNCYIICLFCMTDCIS